MSKWRNVVDNEIENLESGELVWARDRVLRFIRLYIVLKVNSLDMIIFWRVDKMHNPEFWSILTPRGQGEEKEPLKDTEKEWG